MKIKIIQQKCNCIYPCKVELQLCLPRPLFSVITTLLPGRWKGQAPLTEHLLKRIFQSYGKMSPLSKASPWTCEVINSFRLQPITLIQLLVIKKWPEIYQMSLLSEITCFWQLWKIEDSLKCVVSILLEVIYLFIFAFPGDTRNIRF